MVDHHVTDVIIAVLIYLRSVFQQMTVLIYVVDKCLSVFILDGSLTVLFDFRIHFAVKTEFPILLCCRSRNGVDLEMCIRDRYGT